MEHRSRIVPDRCIGLALSVGLVLSASNSRAGDSSAVEFFEKNVRPILVERCQGCHGPVKRKGGLRLDSREAILTGGTSGPAVTPGKADSSLLVDAINYGELYQMPPKSKLPAEEIAVLTRWVKEGAPWGFVAPAKAGPTLAGRPEKSTLTPLDAPGEFDRRAGYWSFQPLRKVDPPVMGQGRDRPDWPRNPIDRLLLAELVSHGLQPAPEADRRTLIRRLTFDLIGLPPTPAEVRAFLADDAPDAYERLVDRLLASPHPGERWGRHWLDLTRFAETAGHEFDYELPNAHRYRDYVIRAFNLDLPYNRFVVEQVAGDLLDPPRRHPAQGFNESIIGTGFFCLGEGTHSPVDVREEETRRIDNQIDVFSKTFLGLTVACARCHDHKFDPITSRDYYALSGYLQSSRHQQAFIDSEDRIDEKVHRLRQLKEMVGAILAESRPRFSHPIRDALIGASKGVTGEANQVPPPFESFAHDSWGGWTVTGEAFGARPTAAGDFRLVAGPSTAWLIPVRSGQAHSGLVSDRLHGVLRSRTFTLEHRYLQYLASGRGGKINVVVDGFEKIRDPIYGVLSMAVDMGDPPRWITQDVGMWLGHRAYLEIADGAAADFGGAQTHVTDGHGFVAIDEIRMSDTPEPPAPPPVKAGPIDLEELISALRAECDAPASRLALALSEYRSVESSLAEPALALAIADGPGENARLLIRGNHKNPGEVVPRRFLAVLGGPDQGSPASGSGRLELAERMVDPRSDPLLPRVMVNRLWKHHFGEGLVRSTDDFGAMGQKPSHPELLDWLAAELVRSGWSLKAMHRLMVTSSAYRMTSALQGEAERLDPGNVFLHRMNVRRLEAESIRDALLACSGRLDPAMFGPGVAPYLSPFMEGRGRPRASGPLDGDGRRSIYLNVRRNFLNPMFLAFDAPVPFSTMGRRNVSNVPAQALTLMNDPLVVRLAGLWAERLLSSPGATDRQRIAILFETAFGRLPDDREAADCLAFLRSRTSASQDVAPREAWRDLCHVLINVKELIYID
jgi:hypothetical protein